MGWRNDSANKSALRSHIIVVITYTAEIRIKQVSQNVDKHVKWSNNFASKAVYANLLLIDVMHTKWASSLMNLTQKQSRSS